MFFRIQDGVVQLARYKIVRIFDMPQWNDSGERTGVAPQEFVEPYFSAEEKDARVALLTERKIKFSVEEIDISAYEWLEGRTDIATFAVAEVAAEIGETAWLASRPPTLESMSAQVEEINEIVDSLVIANLVGGNISVPPTRIRALYASGKINAATLDIAVEKCLITKKSATEIKREVAVISVERGGNSDERHT